MKLHTFHIIPTETPKQADALCARIEYDRHSDIRLELVTHSYWIEDDNLCGVVLEGKGLHATIIQNAIDEYLSALKL